MIRSVLVKIGLATASCVSCFLLVLSIVSMVEGPPGVFWSFYFIHPVLWSAVAASQVLDPPEFYGPFWPHYQVQSTENKNLCTSTPGVDCIYSSGLFGLGILGA
jgi:hypothetical protein